MAYKGYKNKNLGFSTKALHFGYDPKKHLNSKAIPIYQTSVFELENFERGIGIYEGEIEALSYGRTGNPTTEIFEKRFASLEGVENAIAMSSGISASASLFMALTELGDNIIVPTTLYGGNTMLLKKNLKNQGVETRFIDDYNNLEKYERAIDENTKLIFAETLGNPNSNIIDIEGLADLAHKYNVPFAVDNTFATPYLLKPMDFGTDISIYSATKYICGSGIAIGGIICFSGKFDYTVNAKLKKFYEENKPDKSELLYRFIKDEFLCNLGVTLSPTSSFYMLQGLETLSIRMDKHYENAKKVAEFLDGRDDIYDISFEGLKNGKLLKKYFKRGLPGIFTFRVKGGIERVKKICNSVELFDYLVSVGDAKSLIVHPMTTTHYGHSKEELKRMGVFENTIRLSVGIEDSKDLISDLQQALK